MKALWALAGAVTLCTAQPAAASTIEFFEGNNCTQSKLGGLNLSEHLTSGKDKITILSRNTVRSLGITVYSKQPWNDEARSALITSNWRREREARTGAIALYDSPDAKRDDDWVRIVIRDASLIPSRGVCIGSFERNFDRDGVYLERHPNNGLDGKISWIGSTCDAACRANLTADPNPPAPTKPRLVISTPDPARRPLTAEQRKILKKRPSQ